MHAIIPKPNKRPREEAVVAGGIDIDAYGGADILVDREGGGASDVGSGASVEDIDNGEDGGGASASNSGCSALEQMPDNVLCCILNHVGLDELLEHCLWTVSRRFLLLIRFVGVGAIFEGALAAHQLVPEREDKHDELFRLASLGRLGMLSGAASLEISLEMLHTFLVGTNCERVLTQFLRDEGRKMSRIKISADIYDGYSGFDSEEDELDFAEECLTWAREIFQITCMGLAGTSSLRSLEFNYIAVGPHPIPSADQLRLFLSGLAGLEELTLPSQLVLKTSAIDAVARALPRLKRLAFGRWEGHSGCPMGCLSPFAELEELNVQSASHVPYGAPSLPSLRVLRVGAGSRTVPNTASYDRFPDRRSLQLRLGNMPLLEELNIAAAALAACPKLTSATLCHPFPDREHASDLDEFEFGGELAAYRALGRLLYPAFGKHLRFCLHLGQPAAQVDVAFEFHPSAKFN
eukprot:tig00000178_g12792.t1